jgi:uncharacterized membrane protein YesL
MKEKRQGFSQAFSYDGSFYTWTGKFFDLMAVSFFWLLGCLPIVTAGAAWSAMYSAVSRSVRQDIGTVGKKFWNAYRRDMKPSIPVWLTFAGGILVLLLNIGILHSKTTGLFGLFFMMFYALCILILIMAACYAFPALSRFDMPAGWVIKVSFYMTFRHFPVSLLLLLLFGVSYLLILKIPLLVVFVPGIATLLSSFLIEPLLERHMPKEN